ncbi:FAD-binding oxidoreductase [Bradyrhizobium sp. 197]|uniref:NAD(P)/FAD-dependent oxidoreductase n=1 Tax=Bradyrhizobium sp. 197 TaxID=2782663 RepID=UPI001FF9E1A1|nr:FAD-dependent oxidoreductase [Bradyrhizobium sp. 197]MCK1479701.1 FAD-binding oxidoreductase [Bradyrhizobium sp. 197]
MTDIYQRRQVFRPCSGSCRLCPGAATARGAILLPNTAALAVNISAGKVTGDGERYNRRSACRGCRWCVDATGCGGQRDSRAARTTRQQLIVTQPLDGVHANLPMIRIMDAAVYTRPCQGGLLWGVYAEAPRFFDMQSLGPNFDIKDMPLDIEVLRSAATDIKDLLPILQTACVRELRGGIPTMTADGHHILGPAPGAEGFYFASGCNVADLSISPAVREALATWIVDGKPPFDLSPMSCMRFKDASWSEGQLRRDAAWQYRHFYGAV